MANIEPHIEVYDVAKIQQQGYGAAGKIAVIGAFPTTAASTRVNVYTSYDKARDDLKGAYRTIDDNSIANKSLDPVPATYISFYCLDYLFGRFRKSTGAESITIVNTNANGSLTPAITNADILAATKVLAEEDFDILTIADNTTLVTSTTVNSETTYILNPVWETLKGFENDMFKAQKPFGVITGIDLTSNATTTLLEEFKKLWNDRGVFKAVVTPVKLNGASAALNIASSGCWHAAYTAGRPANKSETAKVYDELMGENSKDKFPTTEDIDWQDLLANGFHTTKYKNRRLQTIQCLSNITPADYDMKIERVKNYMIKRLTLEDWLGDDNNNVTRDSIKGKFEAEKQLAIQNKFLVDMEYTLVNLETDKVKANLKLYIPDIIRVLRLDVTLEITAYEEA